MFLKSSLRIVAGVRTKLEHQQGNTPMTRQLLSDILGAAALSVTTVVMFWLPALIGV